VISNLFQKGNINLEKKEEKSKIIAFGRVSNPEIFFSYTNKVVF